MSDWSLIDKFKDARGTSRPVRVYGMDDKGRIFDGMAYRYYGYWLPCHKKFLGPKRVFPAYFKEIKAPADPTI